MFADLFAGTSGPRDAHIAIVGESWGRDEEAARQPFVGASGQELTRMLADAGISRNECFLTNVVAARPAENDMRNFFVPIKEAKAYAPVRGLCPLPVVRAGLDTLHQQLEAVAPKVIIAFGNYALWALTAGSFKCKTEKGWKIPTGIGNWRGSYLFCDAGPSEQSRQRVVVPTYHPAAILRQWPWRTYAVHDLRRARQVALDGGVPPEQPRRFITSPTFDQVVRTLNELILLPEGSWLTCDVETHAGHIDSIGLAWSSSDAICIPLFSKFSGKAYWSLDEEWEIFQLLRVLFAMRLRWSNQNILYDLQYLDGYCLPLQRPSWDTMLAHHLMFPGTDKDLSTLSSMYCKHHCYWGESSDHESDEQRWHYNCLDTTKTWEITAVTREAVASLGMSDLMQERLDVLYEVAFDMMRRGVRIDMDFRKASIMSLVERTMELECYIDQFMPPELKPLLRGKTSKSEWYKSSTQQATFFYDLCGIPAILHPKTKRPTVDDDALPKIAQMQPILGPMIDGIQELRTTGIILNQASMALHPDNRARCSFNVAGPVSFRWSSSEDAFGKGTNLQNITKEKSE